MMASYDDRDKPRRHAPFGCSGSLKRLLSRINIGKPAFKMKAVLGNGEVVDGSWDGRYAPADRKKKEDRLAKKKKKAKGKKR